LTFSGEAFSFPEEGLRLHLVYLMYVGGARLAGALPESFAYRVARVAGACAARTSVKKRKVVASNLARVVGRSPDSKEVRALVVKAYESYARYWLEAFRLAAQPPQLFLERFICDGVERLDELAGRGAVLVIPHTGNPDAAGAWAAASGRPVTTVAELVRPRRLFEFMKGRRERLGIELHPARRESGRKLLAAAKAGRLVALIGDRDLAGDGPEVSFFGEAAPFPAGPAWISVTAGVPLLVAGVWPVILADGRRGWRAEIGEAIEPPHRGGRGAVTELTQEIATRLEPLVARHPEEWHVFQPFWSVDRRKAAG
jgi:phosphatidylinositol dimannoside acyltransferase